MSTIELNLETDTVVLPHESLPQTMLKSAFSARRSTRSFLLDEVPLRMLSALVWVAGGINRRSRQGRTAPSAHDWQEIDVYVVLREGAYRYDASSHQLLLVRAEDLRASTGVQDFVAQAPVNLVYVADLARMTDSTEEERGFLAGADTGFMAQNVYLYCAAAGLGTVVRGLIDRKRLAAALGLRPTQRITLAQTVGYPAAVA